MMAEGEDILYESLDSHTSDEEADEYITVSTPLPYLQPEVPYKNTPPISLPAQSRVGVRDHPPPPPFSKEVQLPPPIQGSQPGRKPLLRPAQALYETKEKKAVPPNPLKLPPKTAGAASPSRAPTTDYHKLKDDDNQQPPPLRPKPAPLPKPRFSLKSSRKKKKANVRYVRPPQGQHGPIAQQENLLPPKPEDPQTQSEFLEDDDVYYDKVLSRTKWRNILKKKKKMKMSAKQPVVASYPVEEHYKDNIVSSTESSSFGAKKALEYSDDELKLKSGNPRVVCILLSIILVALLMSIVSLAVSMVSVSQTRKVEKMLKDMSAPTLNCTTDVMSSTNWTNLDGVAIPINRSGSVFRAVVVQSVVEHTVSWSCDVTTPTSRRWENLTYSYSSASSENHTHTCECTCLGLANSLSPKAACELKTTLCSVTIKN